MLCKSVNFHLIIEVHLRPSMSAFLLLMVQLLLSGFAGVFFGRFLMKKALGLMKYSIVD